MVDGTDLRFARITFGEGPSHLEIDDILQDDQGFLWIGAQNGLKRFDDYSIREFHSEPNDLNSPTGSYAIRLLKDGSGKIWTVAVAFILLTLACGYYLRLQNMEWQFNLRLEERVSKRTRIARELHDTLLQSFHGPMFRIHAAPNLFSR
jgi:signal transduction histidine kinase